MNSKLYKVIKRAVPKQQLNLLVEAAKQVPAFSGARPSVYHVDNLASSVHGRCLYHLEHYAKEQRISVWQPTRFTAHVLNYGPDECIRWHVDFRPHDSGSHARKVSCSLALTKSAHIFQLVVEDGALTINQEPGDLVLFPGWAAHRVGTGLEVGVADDTRDRWSFAMWLDGPDFK
jgi:hypothetical protein